MFAEASNTDPICSCFVETEDTRQRTTALEDAKRAAQEHDDARRDRHLSRQRREESDRQRLREEREATQRQLQSAKDGLLSRRRGAAEEV